MSAVSFEMRRSFAFINGELKFCPRRNVSNVDWLVGELGYSVEQFANIVHGQYYPGRAYFYKGVKDTTTDDEVEEVAKKCMSLFNKETEICCGAYPAEVGTLWEPRKMIGHGTKEGISVPDEKV